MQSLLSPLLRLHRCRLLVIMLTWPSSNRYEDSDLEDDEEGEEEEDEEEEDVNGEEEAEAEPEGM